MRTARHRNPENFLAALRRNGHGIAEEALLAAKEAADEALVMGLRLIEGIDPDAIAHRFGLGSVVDRTKVEQLVTSGHLIRNGSRIALTDAGRLLLDYILAEVSAERFISAAAAETPVSAAA
jgi:oxygen-independent coproporphyrinogen-3 oxidase